MSRLKAVLLDLDGTLIDSMQILYQIYRQFLEHYGLLGSVAEFREISGPSIPEAVVFLKERYRLPGSVEELLERYLALIFQNYPKGVRLFPGTREFLTFLAKQPLQIVLVTSALKKIADAALREQGIERYFTTIVTPDGLLKSKPDPAIYLLAIEKLMMAPSDVLVVEDSLSGVSSALSAKLPTLRIGHDGSTLQLPKLPLIQAKNWEEVRKVIEMRLVGIS